MDDPSGSNNRQQATSNTPQTIQMKITLFTSNQPRHLSLIRALSSVADEVFAIQECSTIAPGQVDDFFRKSPVMQDYFSRVLAAEAQVFGQVGFPPKNVRQLPIRMGDVNRLTPDDFDSSPLPEGNGVATDFPLLPDDFDSSPLARERGVVTNSPRSSDDFDSSPLARNAGRGPGRGSSPALDADLFLVFGASFIKGWLCEHLVKRKAINIHMGVSPCYRGSSTNFWAMHDRRPDRVGATIHRLTTGLDSGPILYHAFPAPQPADPFVFGMLAVKAAHDSIIDHIKSGDLLDLESIPQDRTKELRYTRNADFTDAVAQDYLNHLPTPAEMFNTISARDNTLFHHPHFTPTSQP